jgi:hypothetical protein
MLSSSGTYLVCRQGLHGAVVYEQRGCSKRPGGWMRWSERRGGSGPRFALSSSGTQSWRLLSSRRAAFVIRPLDTNTRRRKNLGAAAIDPNNNLEGVRCWAPTLRILWPCLSHQLRRDSGLTLYVTARVDVRRPNQNRVLTTLRSHARREKPRPRHWRRVALRRCVGSRLWLCSYRVWIYALARSIAAHATCEFDRVYRYR